MREYLALPAVAALAAAVIGFSSPAAATTLSEALKICNKRGSCQVWTQPGKKWVNIKSGDNEIACPKGGGQCQCLQCPPKPTRTSAPGGVKVGSGGVLTNNTGGGQPKAQEGKPATGGGKWSGTVVNTNSNAQPRPAGGAWSATTGTIQPRPVGGTWSANGASPRFANTGQSGSKKR
jgi:hypothetical protein